MTTTRLPYSYNRGSKQGSVYIFNKDEDSPTSEDENIPLKSVRSRTKVKQEVKDALDAISHDVQPSDTLTSLSIKYNCKVSEIKRINHIWNANELSARDSVLIPIVKHSLLLEQDITNTPNLPDKTQQTVDIRTISIKSLSDSTLDTKMFLERMNADIETLLAATRNKTKKSSLSEVKSALTVERIFPKQVTSRRTGTSYCNLLVIFVGFCFLFVGIPVTLVYWEVVVQGIRNVGR